VKSNSSVLGEPAQIGADQAEIERIAQQCAEADTRVAGQIAEILQVNWNVEGLKEVLRAVLPLDETSEREWGLRVSLWGRELSDPAALEPHLRRLAERRARVCERVREAQSQGWVRGDLPAKRGRPR
jgi:hypothetical protein